VFLPILQHLESNGVHYFGKMPSRLEPTRETAGRFSRVLRVRVDLGDRTFTVFVKRYEAQSGTPEEELRFKRYVITEYNRTLLAARCATPSADVTRAIACLPDDFALVTEEAHGVGLDALFRRLAIVRTRAAREHAERALAQVGGWLREFQAGVPVIKTRVRDYRRYLDIRLQALVRAEHPGFGEADRAAALALFDAASAHLGPDDLALVPIHGDLCPSNILVRDNAVTVLDLAMSTDGTRCHDLAHLFLHAELAGRHLRLGQSVVDGLTRALLSGFDPSLHAGTPLFRMMLLQHVVCDLAQISHVTRTPTGVFGEWRWRRRLARCLRMAGLRGAGGGPVAATGRRSHPADGAGEVLGQQCAERGLPRPAEQPTEL
jgi:hypothetical protein